MLNLLHLLLLIIAIIGYYWLQPVSSESPTLLSEPLPAVETVNDPPQDSLSNRPVTQTIPPYTDQLPTNISDN